MKKGLWVLLTLMLILPVSPALAERAGGTFHYVAPYGGDLLGLDAHKSTRIQDFLVMTSLNRSLYSWEPGVNKPKMELATKADVSADGKVWTFKLRDDVKFHHGRKLTADDIIFSYNRVASPATKSPSALYVRSSRGPRTSRTARPRPWRVSRRSTTPRSRSPWRTR
jgi:peptide/nickel transport system substrate-binding protein